MNGDERFHDGAAWATGKAPALPIVATGATAGTPGTFTPDGAVTPATGAIIETLAASPQTAWTTGQSVVAVNANIRSWDGSGWVTGVAPAPPVAATGATAGTPGTWTPAGSIPPASVGDLIGGTVVATPATAWTTGQSVLCGDLDPASWDGSDWIDGEAP